MPVYRDSRLWIADTEVVAVRVRPEGWRRVWGLGSRWPYFAGSAFAVRLDVQAKRETGIESRWVTGAPNAPKVHQWGPPIVFPQGAGTDRFYLPEGTILRPGPWRFELRITTTDDAGKRRVAVRDAASFTVVDIDTRIVPWAVGAVVGGGLVGLGWLLEALLRDPCVPR